MDGWEVERAEVGWQSGGWGDGVSKAEVVFKKRDQEMVVLLADESKPEKVFPPTVQVGGELELGFEER